MDQVTEPEKDIPTIYSNVIILHEVDSVGSDYLYHASLSHEDALEDLGQVSQVEGVMGLGWSWKKLGGNGRIDSDSGVYKRLIQRLDCCHRS